MTLAIILFAAVLCAVLWWVDKDLPRGGKRL